MIDYSRLPAHMQDAARRYIEDGIEPGSFLRAVASNDLMGAFSCADDANRAAMYAWVTFFYNEAPRGSHDSPEAYNYWIAIGGLNGRNSND